MGMEGEFLFMKPTSQGSYVELHIFRSPLTKNTFSIHKDVITKLYSVLHYPKIVYGQAAKCALLKKLLYKTICLPLFTVLYCGPVTYNNAFNVHLRYATTQIF